MSFTEGDRVRLRRESRYWGQSNDSVGTIKSYHVSLSDSVVWHNVHWDESDNFHNYPTEDLISICIMYGEEFSDKNKQKERL